MSLSAFLTSLWESGQVHVPKWRTRPIATAEWSAIDDLIRRAATTDRRSLAFEPPEICLASARWSAEMLYRICQFLVDRSVGMDQVNPILAKKCPKEESHQTIYSVDLTMRYLPDVVPLARAVNPDDAVVAELIRLGSDWPLSSVGMSGVPAGSIEPILSHRALRMIYIDRVLERNDRARLEDPRVAAAAIVASGGSLEQPRDSEFHRSVEIQGDDV